MGSHTGFQVVLMLEFPVLIDTDPKKYSDRHKLYLNYQKSFQMWFFKYYHHIIIIEGTNSDDKEMDLYIQLSIKTGGGDRLNQEKQ